jgi:hypothetical protein
MTKAIKFNLALNNHPVRNLEDLLANFNIDDLLEVYQNKMLERWLEVQGLADQLAKVKAINAMEEQKQALELCNIFNIKTSYEEICAAVYPFQFRKEEALRLNKMEQNNFNKEEIISLYHKEYEELCRKMKEKAEDYYYLKNAVKAIYQNYFGLFKLNHRDFYNHYIFDYPLVILSVLANDRMRAIFLEDPTLSLADLANFEKWRNSFLTRYNNKQYLPHSKTCGTEEQYQKLDINSYIFVLSNSNSGYIGRVVQVKDIRFPFDYIDQKYLVFPYVKMYSGITEGFWRDLLPKEKKVMVISMFESNFVRSTGKTGEELNASVVNGKFPLLDGLDYKSNNANHQLYYMEV